MIEINDHKIYPDNNDALEIMALEDVKDTGGAPTVYKVYNADSGDLILSFPFQNGPVGEVGINGLTHEVLLAIAADRLRWYQEGRYRCKANACAITHIEEALHWLQQRTLDRMRRGVEGTNET